MSSGSTADPHLQDDVTRADRRSRHKRKLDLLYDGVTHMKSKSASVMMLAKGERFGQSPAPYLNSRVQHVVGMRVDKAVGYDVPSYGRYMQSDLNYDIKRKFLTYAPAPAHAYDKEAKLHYTGKAWMDVTGRAKAVGGMTIDQALQSEYRNGHGSVVQYTRSQLEDDIAIGNLEVRSSADAELDASGTSGRVTEPLPSNHDVTSAEPEASVQYDDERDQSEPVTVVHDPAVVPTIDQHSLLATALENVRLKVEHEGDEISVADDMQIISDTIAQWYSSAEMANERKQLEHPGQRVK